MTIDDLTTRALRLADELGAGLEPVQTDVPGFSLVRLREPTRLGLSLYSPVFCLVLQGVKTVCTGERAYCFERMKSVVVGMDLPVLARVREASHRAPYVALALDLDVNDLQEMALEIGAPAGHGNGREAISMADGDEVILDAMGRLFGLTARPEAIPILAPLLVREIHYWLLTSPHGAFLRELSRNDSRSARIARVTSRIRRDFTQSLRVADLAGEVGMSASVFHEHFKDLTGTSPLQYQKQLRLMEARRLIRAKGYSVTNAAFEVGYESPTQFSREYSRAFGLSPRQDQDRLSAERSSGQTAA